jgi:hypothetical protein
MNGYLVDRGFTYCDKLAIPNVLQSGIAFSLTKGVIMTNAEFLVLKCRQNLLFRVRSM